MHSHYDFSVQKYNTSTIESWNSFKLDLINENKEYKPESIYVEAEKK